VRRFAAFGICLALASCGRAPPDPPPFRTELFQRAFQDGQWIDAAGQARQTRVVRLGKLRLPSGRIGAIEPFAVRDFQTFTVSVQPGEYAAEAAILEADNDPRVAFARVIFSPKPVAYWKVAVWPTSDPDRVAAGEQPAFPVDGGMGSLMDAVAGEDLEKLGENEGFYKVLNTTFEKATIHELIDTERANVAVFSTGIGDGAYASYFGFSTNGEPVMLVSDFGMFDWTPRP
jgi:hypothetical protein